MELGNTRERVLHGQEGYEPKQGWVRGFSIPGLKEGDAPARRKHQGSVSHTVSSVVMDSKSAVPPGLPETGPVPGSHQSLVQVVLGPRRCPEGSEVI